MMVFIIFIQILIEHFIRNRVDPEQSLTELMFEQ